MYMCTQNILHTGILSLTHTETKVSLTSEKRGGGGEDRLVVGRKVVVVRESGGSGSGGGWIEGGDTCHGKYGEFSRRHTPEEDVTLGG